MVPQAPYSMASGGMEVTQDRVAESLEKAGVYVEKLDYWNPKLTANVAHVFGSELGVAHIVSKLYGLGIPVVTTAMFTPIHPLWLYKVARAIPLLRTKSTMSVRRELLQKSSAVVAISPVEVELLKQFIGLPANVIHMVPNAVSPQFFTTTADEFRRRTGIMTDNIVLCVGTIEPRKNQLRVIEAVRGLGAELVFIGNPGVEYYGKQKEFFDAFEREVKANNSIHWFRTTPHTDPFLASAFAAAKVHVLASVVEAHGMVTIEAAAAGANVVVSDIPTQRTLYGDTVDYAKPTSIGELRAAIVRQLSAPRGSQTIPSFLLNNWDEVARLLINIYQRVVRKH